MILNTGSRTDIPAFYSDWFYNRIEAGYVFSRNPYYPTQITKYLLDPEVVDVLVFCTKNPLPMLERALDCKLNVPQKKMARKECACLLGADIGAYNICGHGCLYCYANYDRETVVQNRKLHNALSPLLIGEVSEYDVIKQAEQKSWKNGQLDFFDLL